MKQTADIRIDSLTYPVYLGFDLWHEIDRLIQPFIQSGGIFIITDDNANACCLPVVKERVPVLAGQPLLSIMPGEISKELPGLARIWTWLMESGAGRNSLLINLGGGVVSDVGGFAAATFNRGMTYINIPTSLIGQVDAAIGSKTGINISGIKNQAGLFYDPAAVFIIPSFLETLPETHIKSGIAEIIKCAALSGYKSWELLKNNDTSEHGHIYRLISETVSFKCRIIAEDPFEHSARKMLNFGHTVGHALESIYNMPGNDKISHGQAVATGMMCEAYLSYKMTGLGINELDEISSVINSYFNLKPIGEDLFEKVAKTIDHDKKKTGNGIGFSLLEGLGKPSPGVLVHHSDLIRSLKYYNEISEQ